MIVRIAFVVACIGAALLIGGFLVLYGLSDPPERGYRRQMRRSRLEQLATMTMVTGTVTLLGAFLLWLISLLGIDL